MDRVRILRRVILATCSLTTLAIFAHCNRSDPSGAAAKTPTAAQLVALQKQSQWDAFGKQVQPFLDTNCVTCHGGDKPEANVTFEGFTDAAVMDKKAHVLTNALKMLREHKMPPSDQAQPTAEELKPVINWLDTFALTVDAADLKNPGHVTMRRLNRAEYNNTMHDLLGLDNKPADAFPEDDAGFGFDNNGDVLSLAPVLMDKYLTAAELSLDRAILVKASEPPAVETLEAGQMEGTTPKALTAVATPAPAGRGAGRGNAPRGRLFPYNGEIFVEKEFAKTGHYVLRMRGYGTAAATPGGGGGGGFGAGAGGAAGRGAGGRGAGGRGPAVRPSIVFKLDGNTVDKPVTVTADFQQPALFAIETPIEIKAGKHLVTLSFVNGATKEESDAAEAAAAEAAAAAAAAATQNAAPNAAVAAAPAQPGRGGFGAGGFGGGRGGRGGGGPPPSPTGKPTLGVLAIEVEGPVDPSIDRMPESYKKVFTALPSDTLSRQDAARQVISTFATRAYRRPVTEQEMTRLMAYWSSVEAGETFEASISHALQPVLASPKFLYRVEDEPSKADPDGVHTLNDYELATRLSYFLWSTMPDEELFALAKAGKLHENLPAQVKRMLASPKSMSLGENFAGQWLQLRKIAGDQPDAKKFPEFDEELRASMLKETQLFFRAIITENRSVLDFLDADFTFVDGRLASLYGIPDVTGPEFHRVSLAGTQRGGLMTQASVLTLTSYPNRTSPVLRGKWVLENLLDAAPPPPPPNVPALEAAKKADANLTLRQQMEAHRQNPTCFSCHAAMDPIGFGLENFNAIGKWRENDPDADNAKIDASGKLPTGESFDGPVPLKKILMGRKDEFTECLVERMLTYALGRGLDVEDRPRIRMIAEALKKDDYKFSALIMQIVLDDAFQKQGTKRGEK